MMSDLAFNLLFITGCIFSYLPALWAKFAFSGKTYTQAKSLVAFFYGLFFTYSHWRFAETGALPFLGVHEREPMGWVSLFMVFAHAYALPTENNNKFWSKRKRNINFKTKS
jgi:hypothetical protein